VDLRCSDYHDWLNGKKETWRRPGESPEEQRGGYGFASAPAVYRGASMDGGQDADRAAALKRLRAGIASMRFSSSGPLPTRDEPHDRS
jgi:hypothetical protein